MLHKQSPIVTADIYGTFGSHRCHPIGWVESQESGLHPVYRIRVIVRIMYWIAQNAVCSRNLGRHMIEDTGVYSILATVSVQSWDSCDSSLNKGVLKVKGQPDCGLATTECLSLPQLSDLSISW